LGGDKEIHANGTKVNFDLNDNNTFTAKTTKGGANLGYQGKFGLPNSKSAGRHFIFDKDTLDKSKDKDKDVP
jgi:hypothetical protein